ncbi:MAG TPA: phage holin family protein [Candidatus Polarisedimenticolaceae bacterium]|nr:phage holin family protein [Candidatus Polarisedimenticolaceae bacterium]
MAFIQAIIAFIGRTVGKILSSLLDWAVVSLFGRVTGNRKLFLWGMMAAAAAWPILLLGVVAPKAALFFLAFVPLSSTVPRGLVRTIWLALALLVPIAVGVTVARQSPTGREEGLGKSLLRGFPITAGLAAAFMVLLVTVPILRLASMARGRHDTYVPLVTSPESYHVAAKVVVTTLERHGIELASVEPPWCAALPSHILQTLGQGAFKGYIADQSAYFRNEELEAILYPNALLLRGASVISARAHALVVEALTGHPDMFQTVASDAQEIERQIQRVWSTYRLNPEAHAKAGPLLSRFDEIAIEIARCPLPFDDWQVVHRQLLQLGRALDGQRQVLETSLPKESLMSATTPHIPIDPITQSLSTRQLIGQLFETVSLLVTKEVELARAELKANLKAELDMVKLLAAGGIVAVFAVNMLLVAAVFALTVWMPGWMAALGVAVLLLIIAGLLGLIGWQRRVSAPLALTRKTVKEDVQWAKERLA